jgi:hypothetical protein
MEKKILLLAIVVGVMELGCLIFYDYAKCSGRNLDSAWIADMCILSLNLVFTIVYILLKPITAKVILTLFCLFFFLLGDIFLQIYSIPFENFMDNPTIYVALAGIFYFLARILLTVLFAIREDGEGDEDEKYGNIDKKMIIFSHTLYTLPYLAFAITYLIIRPTYLSGLNFIYLTFLFGLPQSYAFLNMLLGKGILQLLSTCLLNVSHVMILTLMYNSSIPRLLGLLATNVYWVSLFLLTLTIIPTTKLLYIPIEEEKDF